MASIGIRIERHYRLILELFTVKTKSDNPFGMCHTRMSRRTKIWIFKTTKEPFILASERLT